MSNIDKRALREAAGLLISGEGDWWDEKQLTHEDGLGLSEADGKFIAAANPATMLALLDELEAKDAKIANLTAERDALREGEMGDAKHSNTRAAADIYFQLVEECEIPAGGSLVEYVSELRERAAMLQGADGALTNEGTIPASTPCKDAPEHIWLQTAGVWPENGEFSELTWCSDNQHKDDTLYVRADVVNGNSPVIPDCSCLTCRPVTFTDSRFVVCPDCGNKRCPHANDHRNACTGSNEPGQVGSAYPAAPKQEAK